MTAENIPTPVRVIVPNTPRGTLTFVADSVAAAQPYLRALLAALPRVDGAAVKILRASPRPEATP